MAREIKQIISPQQLGTGAGVLYTVPTNRITVITRITFTNTTSTDRFINLWLVPSGSSPLDENKIIDTTFVAANETFSPSDVEGQALPDGSTIQASAEIAAAITVIGSGTEITI